ncbi:PX domain-containing protein kinase-like protein [Rhopilema esculentum]|uniref:PX domain-containing protein kinase-like protein n=1 Tax=Rhopilema esculentum TaxID=499914 RepID=UPI0031D21B9D
MATAYKRTLDDTTPQACFIEGFFVKDGHTEFVMKVGRGPNPENRWEVQHRYNDFVTLHSILQASGFDLPLPPKKVFGNMDSAFIQERRAGLQQYMDAIMSNRVLANHISVKKFLDPRNYSDEIEKVSQQQAAMFFRSEPNWELAEPLHDLGWRIRKQYFVMKSKDSSKNIKRILSWVEYGPDMVLDFETSIPALLRQLTTLQHPFIYPVEYASCTNKGATIVRNFHPAGSLKDHLYKAKPLTSNVKKYGGKVRCPLEFADVKRCGRQILEALKFLQDKGWPYGHLHVGNVLVDGQSCRLLDIENGLLGVPSIYRSYILSMRKIQDMEALNVYCFGHLLYEITFAEPLNTATLDQFPPSCPPQIQPVLHSILSSSAVKSGLPTIAELISNPLFSDVPVVLQEKPSLKVSKLKESLADARDAIESRIKDDQRKLRQFLRLSKAKSEIMSEEEKKKRKKSVKKKQQSFDETAKPSSAQNSSKRNSVSSPPPPPPQSAPAPPPQPPVAPAPSQPTAPTSSKGRGQLLDSISGFSKGKLKKAETNDRSAPKV